MFVFFTQLSNKDVVDRHGHWLGHSYDFAAKFDEAYPRVTSLVVARGLFRKTFYEVPWKDVHQTSVGFQLRVPFTSIEPRRSYREKDRVTLRKDILDQQVVDTFNRKVVRVNDIHLLRVDDELRLCHVDIGLRGLVRSLGWERFVDATVRILNRHSCYLTDEKLVSWKYVQPLSTVEATGKIKLSVEMAALRQIPPPDISSMLLDLDPYQRAALLKTLDVQTQVDIITELDLKRQKDLIEELDPQAAVQLVEKMPADEATDLLAELSSRDRDHILDALSAKKAREIRELLEHESNSAGGLMTKEFITLSDQMSVGEAIERIRGVEIKKVETIHNAFATDGEGRLLGSVSLRRLLLEPLEAKICDIMQKKPIAAHVGDSVKNVAHLMDKYNLFVLPVVGEKDALEGIITIDDVLHVMVREAWGRS